MSTASRRTLLGGAAALLLVLLFPGWRQKQARNGHRLIYNEEMGHRFLFRPPAPTGEHSWILQVPASECSVEVKKDRLLWQAGMVVAMTAILLISFARFGKEAPLSESLTLRRTAMISLLLAVCLPFPPPDGQPTLFSVAMAPISPFLDNGHVGPWAIPLFAVVSLVTYFVPIFSLVSGLLWWARRRRRTAAA